MREKTGRVSSELSAYDDVVFDGYCKPIYLRLFRRHYKRSNSTEHYCNEYDVTLKGVKMVPELGIFLKDEG
jgi:hypothetical protein